MSTGRALETDVSCALRSCFSVSCGLPVSDKSAAACEEKKIVGHPGSFLLDVVEKVLTFDAKPNSSKRKLKDSRL